MEEDKITCSIEIKISRYLSAISGIRYPKPYNYDKWNIILKFIWILYADVILIAMMVEVCSLMIRISQSPDDLGIFCACFVGAGYALHLILKLFILNRHRELLERLFHEVRTISIELCSNPFDDGYNDFYDGYFKPIVKTALVKGIFEVAATITLILIFIIKSHVVGVPANLVTPALSWTPYDNSENPTYSLTCFFELIVYGSVTMRNAALDLMFWLMLLVPTIQLRYLNNILGIILKDNDEPDGGALNGDHETVVEAKEDIHTAHPEDLNTKFIWWVKYHQRVLSIIQDFKTITSPYLGVNYMTTLLILSLAGLVAISTTSWDIFQQAIINGIVISNTLQLYFISVTGDWLSESSENAAHSGLTSRLFVGDKRLRKDYLFVCARTKRSLEIRFGGIHRLCSENFEQLIRMTVTYLMTIVQLRNEGGRKEPI